MVCHCLTAFQNAGKGLCKIPSEAPSNGSASIGLMRSRSMENQGLNKIRVSIDDGTPIINKTASNPLFFPRYPRLEPSRVSHTPHSHSIVLSHGSALNLQRKFFLDTIGDRRASPSIKSALDFSTEISATRNLLGFSDYRHRSVDFRHPQQRTTIRLAAEKYRQRQWHDRCAKLNGSHRRSWRTSFPITL